MQLRRLQAQLLHLLLAGEQTGAALHAAAGKAAACIDHLSVHGDHLVMVAIVPRHAGGFVDVLHHDDASQQVRDDILVPGVGLHQRRRQPCRAGQPSSERAGLHGIQRQKGGAACMVVAQQGDSGFRGGFVFHHDVLQCAAQCSLNGHLAPGLHFQDGGHRPQNAPQTACPGGAHDRTHRVLVAVHVLFQFPQHRKALPGGIQFPAQPLLGGIGFVQRGLAAAQLELQTGADVAQLLFVFLQRLAVLYGIGQILFGLFQLCGGVPGALFQRGQALPGGVSGCFGGCLCHLCFGALCSAVGKFCPQAVLAGTAGGAGICQPGKLGVQRFDLCRKLFTRRFHGLCHGAVALQRGIRFGGVLLPGGDLLLQGSRTLVVAQNIVFQHGDAAFGAADLLGDAADIPIQALNSNRQLLCLHTDLLSLLLGGLGLPVKALVVGLGGLIVPHLLAHGFPGTVNPIDPQGHFQRFALGAQFQKLLRLGAFFFQRTHPAFQLAKDIPQAL